MARGKRIKTTKDNWKVGDSGDVHEGPRKNDGMKPTAPGSSKYPPREKPIGPGIYLLAKAGEVMHLVSVDVESDSHKMYFVMLPNDDKKYSPDKWRGAVWFGPIDKKDLEMVFM